MTATKTKVIDTVAQLREANLTLAALANRPEPRRVLMCKPQYFDVVDSKNPHMTGEAVDKAKASQQWETLKETITSLGYTMETITPASDLEDMVFAANQVLPGIDENGKPYILPSKMVHASRQREVPHYVQWFSDQGYRVINWSDADQTKGPRFEGQGDAIWHPGKQLLWGAYGYRTEAAAYDLIQEALGVPVLRLKLVNELLYHLDAAFCVLDENTVLLHSGAFDDEGMKLISAVFKNVLDAPLKEACNFACNAIGLGKHVILQKGSPQTCALLKQHGFTPIEIDTSEFIKSGGSAFCLKVQVY